MASGERKLFTIFVDRAGSDGYYADFKTRAGALRRHSRECLNPATDRSVVKEYDDDGNLVRIWADYRSNLNKKKKKQAWAA